MTLKQFLKRSSTLLFLLNNPDLEIGLVIHVDHFDESKYIAYFEPTFIQFLDDVYEVAFNSFWDVISSWDYSHNMPPWWHSEQIRDLAFSEPSLVSDHHMNWRRSKNAKEVV